MCFFWYEWLFRHQLLAYNNQKIHREKPTNTISAIKKHILIKIKQKQSICHFWLKMVILNVVFNTLAYPSVLFLSLRIEALKVVLKLGHVKTFSDHENNPKHESCYRTLIIELISGQCILFAAYNMPHVYKLWYLTYHLPQNYLFMRFYLIVSSSLIIRPCYQMLTDLTKCESNCDFLKWIIS